MLGLQPARLDDSESESRRFRIGERDQHRGSTAPPQGRPPAGPTSASSAVGRPQLLFPGAGVTCGRVSKRAVAHSSQEASCSSDVGHGSTVGPRRTECARWAAACSFRDRGSPLEGPSFLPRDAKRPYTADPLRRARTEPEPLRMQPSGPTVLSHSALHWSWQGQPDGGDPGDHPLAPYPATRQRFSY